MIPRLVLVVAVLACCARTAYADSEDAARKHAAKANKLAAKNKCRLAVPEFNRAYNVLKDPTLLFNRAECERKIGKVDDALSDYEKFLADMPAAPNRAGVEARIAELRGRAAPRPQPSPPPAAEPAATPDGGAKNEGSDPPRKAEKWTD